MNTYANLSMDACHHAQLLIGTREWALSRIAPEYSREGLDVVHHTYTRMSIANARALIRESVLRPVESAKRVFVITTDSILSDAQNALLKLFEEPNAETVFYLIIPREDILLPTLRSRLNVYDIQHEQIPTHVCEAFITLPLALRLSEVALRLKNEDAEWVENMVRDVAQYAQKTKNPRVIELALFITAYVHTTGASRKMLLEHLALSL